MVNVEDCPAAMVTALGDAVVNAVPATLKGETVSACGNGFWIESVHACCVPWEMRPKLMLASASGPVQGGATLNVGAGTTVARRIALTVMRSPGQSTAS